MLDYRDCSTVMALKQRPSLAHIAGTSEMNIAQATKVGSSNTEMR